MIICVYEEMFVTLWTLLFFSWLPDCLAAYRTTGSKLNLE